MKEDLFKNWYSRKELKNFLGFGATKMCSLHRDYDIKNRFRLFNINDKIVFKPGKYEFSNMNIDAMQDQSLILDGYMCGKIISSPDYGNKFNPTYYRMTLEVPVLDDDNNIVV